MSSKSYITRFASLVGVLVFGASVRAGDIVRDGTGHLAVQASGLQFSIQTHDEAWVRAKEEPGARQEADGAVHFRMTAPERSRQQFSFDGTWRAVQTGDVVRVRYALTPTCDVQLRDINVLVELPAGDYVGATIALREGKSVQVPGEPFSSFSAQTRGIVLTGRDGRTCLTLAFDKPCRVTLQDNRRSGGTGLELRLRLGGTQLYKARQTYELTFDVTDGSPARFCDRSAGDVIRAGADWIPVRDSATIEPGSALDFSAFCGKRVRAGTYGYPVVRGQDLVFEGRPGVVQRFYGGNLCFGATQPKDRATAVALARQMARTGYNAVRIHHYDCEICDRKDALTIKPEAMARLDMLLAALIDEGLYITTDLYANRVNIPFRSFGIDRDGVAGHADFKMLVQVHEGAYSNYIAFARAFLGHVNPLTGRALAQEPALCFISLVNEGNLGNYGTQVMRQHPIFAERWQAWLRDRRAVDPATYGRIPESIPLSLHDNSPHVNAFVCFLQEVETRFAARVTKFLREEMKCRALLTNMNGWHYPVAYQLPRVRSYDYVDDHCYVDHPRFLLRAWTLPCQIDNQNVFRGGYRGAYANAYRRDLTRPFAVTEYNYTMPGRSRAVGGLAAGAFAALQNWSGIWRFAWSSRATDDSTKRPLHYFDMATDPLAASGERAFAAFFLRRDLEPLADACAIRLSPEELRSPAAGPSQFLPATLMGVAWQARVGTCMTDALPRDLAWSAPLSVCRTASVDVIRRALPARPSEASPVCVDPMKGTFAVRSPRTCGLFAESGRVTAGDLTATVMRTPASVWAISLDGKPLADSARILLTHATELQDDETAFADSPHRILLKMGHLPHLVRAGQAQVSLRTHARSGRVYALAVDGHRLAEVAAAFADGCVSFTADTAADPKAARFNYEIVTDPPSGAVASGPVGLTVERRENPVGIDAARPRLSWKLPDGVVRQGAYEIDAGVWKSGRIASSEQIDVPWGGPPLASGQRVTWRVRAWDAAGVDLGWSEPATFVAGIMLPADWKARWIASSDPEVTPKFVRRFTVGTGLKRATLHVTGVGFYTAELNAVRIGRKELDPAPTDYDDRVLYSTYVLDGLVRPGENELALTVGHGWFDVRAITDWIFCKAPWRARPCAIAQLELVYADGHRETVVTDDSWREIPSGIAYDDIREGEVICGATDTGLGARVGTCRVVAGPKGRLVAETQPAAEIVETHKPRAIFDLGEGRWFVDFGLDMAGWCEIRFHGLGPGDRVSIRYDERSENGCRPPRDRGIHRGLRIPGSTNVLDRAGAFQTDWYVAAGRPEETYEPRFVYHGFRYVTLTGIKVPLKPDDLTAKVLQTAFRTTGSFRSSDATLNRLVSMADRSYRSNWADGVPTDCPHREKNGWTGDASMASETGQYLYENTAGYEKWLQDVVEAQRADGMIPGIVPTGGWGCDFKGWGGYPGPCWDGALPVIAWTLYVYRGDRTVLEKTYAALVRNVDFWERERTERGKGLVPEGLGDWCTPFRDHLAPTPFVTTAWHCQNAQIAARIAGVLGKPHDVARFVRYADETKKVLNRKFLRTGGRNRGLYVDDRGRGFQTMQAAALAFGIVPDDFRADAERRLIDLVAERYDHLDVGIQGLRVLLRQLSRLGRGDLALKMLLQPTGPCFASWIDAGSTSLREDYRSAASWNHIMFGDFAAWAYQYLAGIRLTETPDACGLPAPTEPAFRRFVIRPDYVPQLDFVEASVESPYGTIRSAWRRLGETRELSVSIPSGTEAEVALPDGSTRLLSAGSYVFRSRRTP